MPPQLSFQFGLGETSNNKAKILKDLSDKIAILKESGYKAVELAVSDPDKIPAVEIKELLSANGMVCCGLGTGAMFVRSRIFYTSDEESKRDLSIKMIEKYASLSANLDDTGENCDVIIGLIRGRTPFSYIDNNERIKTLLTDGLNKSIKICENLGVPIVIEPINRFECDTLNTIGETVEILQHCEQYDKAGILLDNFHVWLEEESNDATNAINQCGRFLKHIHVAASNRRAPGNKFDTFNWSVYRQALAKSGYNKFVSVEVIVKPDFKTCVITAAKTFLDPVSKKFVS